MFNVQLTAPRQAACQPNFHYLAVFPQVFDYYRNQNNTEVDKYHGLFFVVKEEINKYGDTIYKQLNVTNTSSYVDLLSPYVSQVGTVPVSIEAIRLLQSKIQEFKAHSINSQSHLIWFPSSDI